MQNEITASCPVPDKNGTVGSPGWARTEVMRYTRDNVHAPWFRKKEWDYYLFNTKDVAVAFTISDLGYVGLLSASFIDLNTGKEHTESEIGILPRGKKYGLGALLTEAHGECHTKRLDLVFENKDGHRHISCRFRRFDGDRELNCELDVYEPDMEAMYIATPWAEKPTAFYYNCKRNCLEAEGTVQYGERTVSFTRETALGVLDWGRGVWTYDNTWYWGTGSGRVHGEPFGFNLGYGFSDRSAASENALYWKGRIHKLEDVTFGIPQAPDGSFRFTEPWTITSNNGRFEATFTPILDRAADLDFKIIVSNQHQVFGRMNGIALADDGEQIPLQDFICALEVVHNKY